METICKKKTGKKQNCRYVKEVNRCVREIVNKISNAIEMINRRKITMCKKSYSKEKKNAL